jgi:opacity protein-like surface antigen
MGNGFISPFGDLMNALSRSFKPLVVLAASVWVLGIPARTFGQVTDSLGIPTSFASTIQIQLFNGLGVYFIGGFNASTGYRLGVDMSIDYSESTGPEERKQQSGSSYYINNSISHESEVSSHSFEISALALRNYATLSSVSFYSGGGITTKYQYSKNTATSNTTTKTTYDNSGLNSSETSSTKALAIGPMIMVGVQGRLVGIVGVTAEIECRAMYTWTSVSGITSTENLGTSPYRNETHSSGSSEGWSFALASVRVGITLAL